MTKRKISTSIALIAFLLSTAVTVQAQTNLQLVTAPSQEALTLEQKIQNTYVQGIAAKQAGELGAAVRAFRTILRVQPGNIRARRALVDCLMIAGEYEAALWMFQGGGLSNHAALQTATINPARALGFDAQLGSLVAGKLADLLILNSNPLDNIRNSQDIAMVMKNGRLFDAMTMAQLYPDATAAPKLPFMGVAHRLGAGCACHVVR